MIEFLNSAAFSIAGSPASWAELIGAALGIAMVICNMRQIHWGWPLAFASALLYFIVFADAKLYAEAALQIFFALTAIWGWLQWLRGVQPDGQALKVRRIEKLEAIKLGAISAIFLAKFTPSDVPWFDTLPTVLSLAATYLLGKKYIENWPLWIAVNIISIALFAYKGLWLTVGLYAVFAIMAALGWQAWGRAMQVSTQGPAQPHH
jgi:nicotinamide mononucleotide transporter